MSDSGPALARALAQFSSTWFLDLEFGVTQLVAGLEQVHRPDCLGTASSGVSRSMTEAPPGATGGLEGVTSSKQSFSAGSNSRNASTCRVPLYMASCDLFPTTV